MLKSVFPPICLFLALALAITGFSMLAFGGPEASVALHAARAAGDEASTDALEENLQRRKKSRMVRIVLTFAGSGVMTFVAFASMGESKSDR